MALGRLLRSSSIGPPSRLPKQRMRRRLPGLDSRDGVPVHLHLRWIACSAARRRRLAPRLEGGGRCFGRFGLCASRLGNPLSRRLRAPDLGLEHGQERDRRRAYVLSLGRRLGSGRRLHQQLFGTRAQCRRAPHRRARRAHITPVYGQQGQLAKAIDEIPGAQAIKLEPSMRGDKRVAVRFNLVARQASKDVAPSIIRRSSRFRQPQICALVGDGRRATSSRSASMRRPRATAAEPAGLQH